MSGASFCVYVLYKYGVGGKRAAMLIVGLRVCEADIMSKQVWREMRNNLHLGGKWLVFRLTATGVQRKDECLWHCGAMMKVDCASVLMVHSMSGARGTSSQEMPRGVKLV